MSILISHKDVPAHFLRIPQSLDDDTHENMPVIYCQISSNLFFYTTLLSEISISSHFDRIFYNLLIRLTNKSYSKCSRKHLKHIFNCIRFRKNSIYLQVHKIIYRYDEWINRYW